MVISWFICSNSADRADGCVGVMVSTSIAPENIRFIRSDTKFLMVLSPLKIIIWHLSQNRYNRSTRSLPDILVLLTRGDIGC